MWEAWVQSLGGEDPLEKEMATKELDMTEWLQVHFQIATIASGCNIGRHKSFLGKCYLFLLPQPST